MARHGGAREDWLDLSTGINPHAWPLPEVEQRFSHALPAAADETALLAVARMAYGVPADAGIVAAPGTQALIQWLPVLAPPGDVAILGPTYGEHALGWARAGRAVQDITSLAQHGEARHLVVVNPNNPDGRLLGPADLAALGEAAARRGGWLVVDESFVDVAPAASAAALVTALPVVILRSFGKFYGLAGVRLGFAIANPGIADAIRAALGPWAVAGPALAIGRLALADAGWADAMRQRLAREAAALDAVLAGHGEITGGTTLYRLLRHPQATVLHGHLASQHIWVRRFGWDEGLLRFGLPGSEANLKRLQAALAGFAHASPQGDSSISPSTS
jgi:cobalamin biosynthetic protein CobC